MPAPVCQLLYCTTVLFKVLYCKMKNVFFIFCLFFMYYLCEKYYKPITVQYYIANCVSWVPRLTLLDLWTNWTYECPLGMELVHVQGTYCIDSAWVWTFSLLGWHEWPEEFTAHSLNPLGHNWSSWWVGAWNPKFETLPCQELTTWLWASHLASLLLFIWQVMLAEVPSSNNTLRFSAISFTPHMNLASI